MTDYDEEQKGELETLLCIYTEEEFTEVTASPPCFRIHVEAANDVDSTSVDIQFSYPPTYPDVIPELAVVASMGLTEQQAEELEAHLNNLAVENVGMIMIFTLVSGAQDKLSELLDFLGTERERIAKEKEEELQRIEEARFFGTPVTRENFLEWRKKFDEEISKLNLPKKSSDSSTGLTGKQMFEKDASLALSDARFLTEAEASELVDTELEPEDNVEVDESLFQDLDDLQL